MKKKNILLVMHRKILSDALIEGLKDGERFEFQAVQNYASALLTAEACMPGIVIMEIPESGNWKSADKCLAICDMIRKQIPGCKQVLLCSESDAEACRAAIRAKQENRIDDFLYYDTSVKYLFSKLESLI